MHIRAIICDNETHYVLLGFLYAGEHMHSWLAATQYIAPLMANFDTTLSPDSVLMYADTGWISFTIWFVGAFNDITNYIWILNTIFFVFIGDLVVIEWHEVILRNQEKGLRGF